MSNHGDDHHGPTHHHVGHHHVGHHHVGHHHRQSSLAPDSRSVFTTRRLTRRAFVQEFGRRTFGVAILGTGIVAACGSRDQTNTAAADTASASSAPPSAPADDASGELRWERASFGFVSAYVLARGNEFALIDTGTAGNEIQIGATLQMMGATYDDLDHVILTHLHGDHVGSLSGVLNLAEGAVAYAGEADVGSILAPRPITPVNDGDDIFGLQVVATPGHTAGHICLWDQSAGFIALGDSLFETNRDITLAPEQFTSDRDAARSSAQRLGELSYETAVFGHGEPILTGAAAAVASAVVDL